MAQGRVLSVRTFLRVSVALAASGCVGSIAGPSPGGNGPAPDPTTTPAGPTDKPPPPDLLPPTGPMGCQERAPSVVAARRLTRDQYLATVRDLLGDAPDLGDRLPADDKGEAVVTAPETLIVTPTWADKALNTAEHLAHAAIANLGTLLPCKPVAGQQEACAGAFIQAFGKRAFRRPLTSEEVTGLTDVYKTGARDGFERGIEMVIGTILQSPSFLYRLELGQRQGSVSGGIKLSPYEVASRLSYFVWGTMPDQALFDAAEAGRLSTPGGIEQEVDRMMNDPRGKATRLAFAQRWFGLDAIDEIGKDADVYPQWDEKLIASMKGEFSTFIDEVMGPSGDGKLETLLLSDSTYVDEELAALYGVSAPAGTGMRKVTMPMTRKGLLSSVSVLAVHTLSDASAAIHRGKFIRERLLCTVPPDPPPGLEVMPPAPQAGMTTRERLMQHMTDPACTGCHAMMDPLGFAFENFDGIGRYRAMEQGKTIDASGNVSDTDVDGSFVGPVELAQKLATSKVVRTCVMTTLINYAQGPQPTDSCLATKLAKSFDDSKHDIRSLILGIARSDSFQYRRQLSGEVLP